MQFGHPKNAESIFTVNFYRTKHDSTNIKKNIQINVNKTYCNNVCDNKHSKDAEYNVNVNRIERGSNINNAPKQN